MWMRGGQEHPDTQQGDTVPNTDGTWYLRVTLDVAAEQAAGLACRVNHSSLGDQDIILHWGEKDLVQAGNGRRVLRLERGPGDGENHHIHARVDPEMKPPLSPPTRRAKRRGFQIQERRG
ncbi:T-cell surface glycoprotein CD1b-3 [Galemys pyrenaicus]|uniref:T-cell surface glycoprotein CD1b-3 n=1 Tax=Galemys pyrenaicus TaxID=202257 RepID=A0A8J6DTG7_GALPY|nr:T-cell surface glycoprotein CD1b-3 [Galemys pyrenaicus]